MLCSVAGFTGYLSCPELSVDSGKCFCTNAPRKAQDIRKGTPLMELDEEVLAFAEVVPWTLYFDGSSTLGAAGAGVVLISPSGQAPQAAKRLKFQTWRYHRLGKTAFVRSLSFSDEGEWQSLVQLRSKSSYLIERVMLKFFFSYLGLTPRKTKDGRARTDILGKALMNYAIPDTYAVRYQPSSDTTSFPQQCW
ncbi:hypothetical protein R6Q57_019220 [Mikania cordata]